MKGNDNKPNGKSNSNSKSYKKMNIDDSMAPNKEVFDFTPGIDDVEFFSFDLDDDLEDIYDPPKVSRSGSGTRQGQAGQGRQKSQGGKGQKESRRQPEQQTPKRGRPSKKDKQRQAAQENLRQLNEDRKKSKRINKEILVTTYTFLIMFMLLIGYLVYFNVFVSKDIINDARNVRIDSFAAKVLRGDILSSDGKILAQTSVDGEGNEIREYPYSNIFAHVVGTSEINKSGIENYNNFDLLSSNVNPIEKTYNELKGEKNLGNNVVTTLDSSLQQAAYNALGSREGVALVLEPSTGRVLAMVSKPDYDPNTLKENYQSILSDTESKVLLNQATQGLFIPGSIFKIITATEYMRENAVYDQFSYNCTGSITLQSDNGPANIPCYNDTAHGNEDIYGAFANSCNCAFCTIGINLNIGAFANTCKDLFFNTSLPTEIPHQKSRFLLDHTASEWLIGATSMGQGDTTMTPLHAAMIVSAIANGGNMMKPYLVERVETTNGSTVKRNLPSSAGSVFSTGEVNALTKMMSDVVTQGTGYSLSGLGVSVAGKTGTGQTGDGSNNSWFVGFAPVENPRIAIAVLVTGSTGSGDGAMPVASQILSSYFYN